MGRNFFVYTLSMFLIFVIATVYNELNLVFHRAEPFLSNKSIYSIYENG